MRRAPDRPGVALKGDGVVEGKRRDRFAAGGSNRGAERGGKTRGSECGFGRNPRAATTRRRGIGR